MHEKMVRMYESNNLDKVDECIIDLLRNGQGLQTKQISKKINLCDRAGRLRLSALEKKNLVKGVGTSKTDPTRKYFLCGEAVMSYDIKYLTDKKLPEAFEEGGVYEKFGTSECFLNVTWNYSDMFDFYWLDGKSGKEALPVLKEFSDKWKSCKPYERDYWAPTPGNVKKAVDRLISFVKLEEEAKFQVFK